MILLIDNYDSFVYNLYQLLGSIQPDIKVVRNDEITIAQIDELNPDHIVISPGPGRPQDAGIIEDLIRERYQQYPILGVCLGHQAIYEAFGGQVSYAKKIMHGKSSIIKIDNQEKIFKGLNQKIKVARYHSLAGQRDSLPACLQIIGETDDQEIMAVKHVKYSVYGIQFHPESILTDAGKIIIENFMEEKKL